MSHRHGTGPTKVHEALAANLGELIVPRLIVKAKDGTANVAITAEPDRVMVWLSAGTDEAAIGLVCERDKAPYLCLWDESPSSSATPRRPAPRPSSSTRSRRSSRRSTG
jgi:hypothetical protein